MYLYLIYRWRGYAKSSQDLGKVLFYNADKHHLWRIFPRNQPLCVKFHWWLNAGKICVYLKNVSCDQAVESFNSFKKYQLSSNFQKMIIHHRCWSDQTVLIDNYKKNKNVCLSKVPCTWWTCQQPLMHGINGIWNFSLMVIYMVIGTIWNMVILSNSTGLTIDHHCKMVHWPG